jgi:threonine dehydrogenase-like Zn-dependent dehydrogenase
VKSRALVLLGDRNVEVREFDVPAAALPGGAILRVLANGLCGSDYDLYSGKFAGTGMFRPPLIPGHEIVGRIEAIDPAAAEQWGVAEGDRVAVEPMIRCGQCRNCRLGRGNHCTHSFNYSSVPLDVAPGLWGGMSEYMMLRPGSGVYRIPDRLTDEDAVLFNPFGNAFQWTARVGNVSAGDRVLVLGAGQRGLACAAVAATMGARQVIVTGLTRDEAKLALAPEFGATDTIDVEKQDTVAAVADMTSGEGVDVAIDTTPGATAPLVHAIAALRPEGRLVVAGMKGREISGLNTDQIFLKALTVSGAFATVPWATWNALELVASGRFPVHKLHTHRVDLDGAEHAIRVLGGEVPDESALHMTVIPA